jgi:hypothetical protein
MHGSGSGSRFLAESDFALHKMNADPQTLSAHLHYGQSVKNSLFNCRRVPSYKNYEQDLAFHLEGLSSKISAA